MQDVDEEVYFYSACINMAPKKAKSKVETVFFMPRT